MRSLWNSFLLATAMYSRIPVPRADWSDRSMAHVFCFFPWVGLVVGLAELGWFWLSDALSFGPLLFAAGAVLLPAALTGGIHLDGFCDTCDALGSHQSRERKLEILKDTHTGAFALLGLGAYLVLAVGLWSEVQPVLTLALVPVLSRSLSGLLAVTMKNARGSGLLATFSQASHLLQNRVVLVLWAVAASLGILLTGGWSILLAAAAVVGWTVWMCRKEFGGFTGDLAGWFLQIFELAAVAALVLQQKGMGL